jgi:hypothetical protein
VAKNLRRELGGKVFPRTCRDGRYPLTTACPDACWKQARDCGSLAAPFHYALRHMITSPTLTFEKLTAA